MLRLPPLLKLIHSSLDVVIIITMDIGMDIITGMVTMATMERGLLMLRLPLLLKPIHSSSDIDIIITTAMGIIMAMAMAMDPMDKSKKRQTEVVMYTDTKSSVTGLCHGV